MQGMSSPKTALTQHVAVIATEHDDGVLIKPASFQGIEQFANAVIDKAHSTIVCSFCPLNLLVREVFIPDIRHFHQPLAMRVLLFFGDLDLGKVDVNSFIAIPVLLFDGIRIVRVCERDLECGSRS